MALIFQNDEKGYLVWIANHPEGFVLTTKKSKSLDYMVLHSAGCYKISSYNKMAQPGGFTERNYIKVCSDEILSLRTWLVSNGSIDGSFSKICSVCKPVASKSTPRTTIHKVLLKEVGKSQHKDGVRIDKAFHDIFNPASSPFYTKRGATRKIKVAFNGKEFDAEYRFEGTKAKEVDLQRIGFFRGLRDEFKAVFPVPKGTFTIRLGKDVNHFIFDHQQITSDAYDEQLEYEVSKSRKGSKDARQKRLAEAARKPASIQVTSVAFVRNADVIVEVLERAGGKCEVCLNDAPFLRAKDKAPYLEVHHKVPLSEGGEDVVENAIAVCPNCHRKMHYG